MNTDILRSINAYQLLDLLATPENLVLALRLVKEATQDPGSKPAVFATEPGEIKAVFPAVLMLLLEDCPNLDTPRFDEVTIIENGVCAPLSVVIEAYMEFVLEGSDASV